MQPFVGRILATLFFITTCTFLLFWLKAIPHYGPHLSTTEATRLQTADSQVAHTPGVVFQHIEHPRPSVLSGGAQLNAHTHPDRGPTFMPQSWRVPTAPPIGYSHNQSSRAYSALASWYGPGFQGRRMANGEIFNMHDPSTVAHKTLPFGTRLYLTNPQNNHSIIVVVRDRGPYIHGRDLDLSYSAASQLGFAGSGLAYLQVSLIDN